MKSFFSLILLALFLSFSPAPAKSALIFEVSEFTPTTFSFSITGTFDSDTTTGSIWKYPGTLGIKYDWSNNYGRHTDFMNSVSSYTGSMTIGSLTPSIYINNTAAANADSIYWENSNIYDPFTAGTSVSGNYSLTGDFIPSTLPKLELLSGFGRGRPPNNDWSRLEATATATTAAATPEPATISLGLLSAGAAGWAARRRRKAQEI